MTALTNQPLCRKINCFKPARPANADRKIREINRVQQHGTSATKTNTGQAASRKWRIIISAVITIAAGSAITGAYVLTSDQVAVVTADIYALFSGVVQQLGQFAGLE